MKIRNATKQGYITVPVGGCCCYAYPESQLRRGRVIADGKISPTLDCGCKVGVVMSETKIRRLTPRECFRLQGWKDKYFDRAAQINFDNKLYKQAGNGVTVDVIKAIAERL